MKEKLRRILPGSLWLYRAMPALIVMFLCNAVIADEITIAKVVSIVGKKVGHQQEFSIKGDNNLAFITYELATPPKVVMDLANTELKQGVSPRIIGSSNISVQTKEISEGSIKKLRIEFLLDKPAQYTTKQDGNSIIVTFNQSGAAVTPSDATASLAKQLPSTKATALPSLSAGNGDGDFGFSGYNRERISVDFYKMDLHNVFRFLREISGVNIVVDEEVKGALTLTLDNVPWDFALDVILNLKDLRKEERFNTIVVYPKKKEFAWPGKSETNLSFKEDASQQSLVITQMEQGNPGMVEAAELIAKGNEYEKSHNPAMAVKAYEEAFAKWSTNAKLAKRIAAIYLSDLHQNAKALQYAKKSLAIDKKDKSAALYAAIASANMRDMRAAATYFDMSVQGRMPRQEALLNYAFFREDSRQYDQALRILDKHDGLYGRNLDSMIARARIFDKKGDGAQAVRAYRAILSSGFALPADLSRYVRARVGMAN